MTAAGSDRAAARRAHWESVHAGKAPDSVSWWQPVPALSLDLIERGGVPAHAGVVDVGGGSSTLVDQLLARGHTDLTVVDLSDAALRTVRDRLGARGRGVVLRVADALDLDLGRRFALWHDRAVFHFLVEVAERDAYRASLERCLEPEGFVVVATFGPTGPTTCSGLPVVRYDHAELAAEFPGFDLVAGSGEEHLTPSGAAQQFTAVLLRRRP